MIAAPASSYATQRSCDDPGPEDDGLRIAALKSLRSSGYAALRGIQCEVTQAVAIIQGVVPSYFLKQMAQSVIQRVDGVRSIRNLVEVRLTGQAE
jgi:hypothetical protein